MEQVTQNQFPQIHNKRFQFNLSKNHLQCFISKPQKSKSSRKSSPKLSQHKKPLFQLIQQHSPAKPYNSPYINLYFDHKVLFTNYGPQEVYVDEELNNTDFNHVSSNSDEQELEQSEVVSQCMRAITEDTADNSNSFSSSIQAMQYYNQQIMEMSRYRTKLNAQQPVYCIRPGQSQYDGRTTLMLRNIPNKYTQEMVLQEVESSGLQMKYDFFYLPIDFKNDCNVGYAFINLIGVQHVQKIFQKFHGKRWPKFNSEKICQVCYARIQGTPQLINHFRFSSSAQRDNRCRPLIYVNLNGEQSKAKDDQNIMNKHHGCLSI